MGHQLYTKFLSQILFHNTSSLGVVRSNPGAAEVYSGYILLAGYLPVLKEALKGANTYEMKNPLILKTPE